MPLVLACLDEVPPTDTNPCVQQAWIEMQQMLPTLTASEASEIGMAFLWLAAGLAAIKMIRHAT